MACEIEDRTQWPKESEAQENKKLGTDRSLVASGNNDNAIIPLSAKREIERQTNE